MLLKSPFCAAFPSDAHLFKSKTQKGLLLWPRLLTDVVQKQNVTKNELNTPKVSENLVRFTSPLFTGKAPQSPENIFGMSTIIFKMNI